MLLQESRLQQIFAEHLAPLLAAQKQRRQKSRRLRLILLGVIWTAALILLAKYQQDWPLIGIVAGVCSILIAFWGGNGNRMYEVNAVAAIAGAHDYTYCPEQGIEQEEFEQILPGAGRVDEYAHSEYIGGVCGKTSFAFSMVEATEVTHDAETDTDKRSTLFKGMIFKADFNKHVEYRTAILPDLAEKFFGQLVGGVLQKGRALLTFGKLIKLEDVEFEKHFVVYGANEQECRYLLTPDFMARLVKLYLAWHKGLRFVLQNETLYVLCECDCLFRAKLSRKFDPVEHLRQIDETLESYTSIIAQLDLNTRIWSKE